MQCNIAKKTGISSVPNGVEISSDTTNGRTKAVRMARKGRDEGRRRVSLHCGIDLSDTDSYISIIS